MPKSNTKKFYSYELSDEISQCQWRVIEFYHDIEDTSSYLAKQEIEQHGIAIRVMEITVNYPKVDILGRLT